MMYFVIVLVLAVFAIPHAFAEELFYGKSSFERVPEQIIPEKPYEFDIKFQYTDGPYQLQNLTAIIETVPKSASRHISIDVGPTYANPNSITRIPVEITVDEKIRHEKIFLVVTYTGTGLHGVPFKSAWADSLILDIAPKDLKGFGPVDDCVPIELKSSISDGSVLITCRGTNTNSVMIIGNAFSNSTVSVDIPKKMLYALTTLDCKVTNDFFVLINGEEVLADIKENGDVNTVTVDVTQGISEVEIVGAVIIPDPSPIQYCGIVEGYDKLYLAPHDQVDHGVDPQFVRCNEGLFLIQKINDSPACVKQDTALKLIERGWVKTSTDVPSSRHCTLVPETGPCKAAFTRYYFDPDTRSCKSFTWGGCDGTVPFDTLELCQALCS